MPTYQYACTEADCGHRFEAVQSFSDPSLTSCPVCNGSLRKVFSSVGVVFKGSGFYRTDSRSGPDTKVSAESKSSEKSAEKSSDKASEKASGDSSKSESSTSSAAKSGSGSGGKATAGAGSSASTAKAAAP